MSRLFISSYALHRCIRCVHASHPVVFTSISDPIQPDINLDEDEDRDEKKRRNFFDFVAASLRFSFRFRLAARLLIVFIYLLMLFFMTHKKPLCSSIGCELRAESVNMSAFTLNPALALNEIFSYISSFIPTVAYAFNSAKKKKAAVRERAAYIIKCCKMRTLRWGGTDGFGAHSRAVINCSTSSVSHTEPTIKREEWKQTLKLDRCTSELFSWCGGIFGWNSPHQFVLLDCEKWKKCFISSWDLGAPSWQSFLHAYG